MDLSIAYNFLNAIKNHNFNKEFSTHLKIFIIEKRSKNNLSINCKLKKINYNY